jgi:demethylmenaquinone methyltransferase/2-methoxy-6-polyprenyl-1,4-benzoquinol methylase
MEESNAIRDFFDRLAPNWTDNAAEYDQREALTERIGLPEKAVIADIGCGKGVMLPHLLKRNPGQIIAVDLSGEMIKAARAAHQDERIRFIRGDLLELELPQLDAAVLFNAYPHFMDKAALARKLTLLVRPGGIVAIMHSAGRAVINGRHERASGPVIAAHLRDAKQEAAEFAPAFALDVYEETENHYFIRLIRTEIGS